MYVKLGQTSWIILLCISCLPSHSSIVPGIPDFAFMRCTSATHFSADLRTGNCDGIFFGLRQVDWWSNALKLLASNQICSLSEVSGFPALTIRLTWSFQTLTKCWRFWLISSAFCSFFFLGLWCLPCVVLRCLNQYGKTGLHNAGTCLHMRSTWPHVEAQDIHQGSMANPRGKRRRLGKVRQDKLPRTSTENTFYPQVYWISASSAFGIYSCHVRNAALSLSISAATVLPA